MRTLPQQPACSVRTSGYIHGCTMMARRMWPTVWQGRPRYKRKEEEPCRAAAVPVAAVAAQRIGLSYYLGRRGRASTLQQRTRYFHTSHRCGTADMI